MSKISPVTITNSLTHQTAVMVVALVGERVVPLSYSDEVGRRRRVVGREGGGDVEGGGGKRGEVGGMVA